MMPLVPQAKWPVLSSFSNCSWVQQNQGFLIFAIEALLKLIFWYACRACNYLKLYLSMVDPHHTPVIFYLLGWAELFLNLSAIYIICNMHMHILENHLKYLFWDTSNICNFSNISTTLGHGSQRLRPFPCLPQHHPNIILLFILISV